MSNPNTWISPNTWGGAPPPSGGGGMFGPIEIQPVSMLSITLIELTLITN